MRWSLSPSRERRSAAGKVLAQAPIRGDDVGSLRRHFVEALRRAEIVSLVNAAGDEEELGRTFVEELCEVFDAEVAFLLDGGSSATVPRVIATVGLNASQASEILDDPVCGEALTGERAICVDGATIRGFHAESAVLTPVRTRSGRVLLTGVARLYEKPFEALEVTLLEAVAESAGHALERIWAFEERDRRSAQQAALVRAAKALNRSLEIDQVLAALCEEVAEALEADASATYLGNERDGYTCVAIANLDESVRGITRPAGEGLGGKAVRERGAVITHDYQGEGLAPTGTPALDHIRAGIAVPLGWDGRDQGSLIAGFTGERRLGEQEIELIEGFAELAALACANAERHAAMRDAADQDALTGCFNQGAFRRALRSRAEAAKQAGEPLSLALLDLDNFKRVNDTAGHPAGDSVLREVGKVLLAAVREEDLAARYGGDEFAVVLPGLKRESAQPVITRLLEKLARVELPDGSRLGARAGIADWRPGETAQSLIDRADTALLRAKRSEGGTGRVLTG